MILGINFKEEDPKEDTYRVTKITVIVDESSQYDLINIEDVMKTHDMCFLVPNRESYPYKVLDVDTFNHLVYFMKNKFTEYSKANHTDRTFHNFLFKAGIMYGEMIVSKKIDEKIKEIWGY